MSRPHPPPRRGGYLGPHTAAASRASRPGDYRANSVVKPPDGQRKDLAAHQIRHVTGAFPLWDAKRQTLADKIMTTVCVPL